MKPRPVRSSSPDRFVLPDVPVAAFDVPAPARRRLATTVKGAFDVIASAALIVLLSPLLAALMIAIVLDSPGGPFFVQPRVGRHGRIFKVLKFRTMRREAPRLRERLIDDGGPERLIFKMKDDPRVTRLGRFLRKSSLDELPQLVNVALGEMSLVGPRPLLLEDFQNTDLDTPGYEEWFYERHRFKPGITGLWQVSGRSRLSFAETMALDVRYAREWSLWLDLKILLRTPAAVLRGAD